MIKYGVIANRQGQSPFVFCMTESQERAASLMHHYQVQSPFMIYRIEQIKESSCTGDDYFLAKVTP